MQSPRVLISGAGIAGLALALRLERLGIDYTIIEKRDVFSQRSSGIALPFNSVRALEVLGVADRVLKAAHLVDEVFYTKPNGKLLAKARLDQKPFSQDKFIALRRSELLNILGESIRSQIHFSTIVTSIKQEQDDVYVSFNDEILNGRFDLVVSAEGVHSALRQQCFPDEETTIDHKVTNWRFIAEYPKHQLQPTYTFGRTDVFMAYPISPDTLYCYCHIYDENGQYLQGDAKRHIQKITHRYGGKIKNILSCLDKQEIIAGRLRSVSRPYFFDGRIAFVGDAANACSPLLQQGAAAAFEDVICLSTFLAKVPVEKAIIDYKKHRQERVEWIINTSDKPFKKIKMMRSFHGALLRNLLVRASGPLNVHGWKKLAEKSGIVV